MHGGRGERERATGVGAGTSMGEEDAGVVESYATVEEENVGVGAGTRHHPGQRGAHAAQAGMAVEWLSAQSRCRVSERGRHRRRKQVES